MDSSIFLITFLLLALIFSVITNFYNSKKLNSVEKALYESYRNNREIKSFIEETLKGKSEVEAIKRIRTKYGLSIEHAKKIIDFYK
jgi:ribosomal protein L7/L12